MLWWWWWCVDTWRNHSDAGVGWDQELLKEEAIHDLDEEIQLEVDQTARLELARLKSVCCIHFFMFKHLVNR